MAALTSRVADALARRADPVAAEQHRLERWLRSLPRGRRKQVLRGRVATINGRPTAVYDRLVVLARSRQMLTPHLVAHLGIEISPEQWAAICDAADGVRLLDASQAAAIRDAIGELPGRWGWPKTWFRDGLVYVEYVRRTIETRPIPTALKK